MYASVTRSFFCDSERLSEVGLKEKEIKVEGLDLMDRHKSSTLTT